MFRNKKVLIILVIALFLLCILSMLCLGILYKVFSSTFRQGNEIKNGILTDVCESHGIFSETEYKAWFSKNYRQSVDYLKATNDIGNIFAEDFDCNTIKTNNIFEILKKKQSINIDFTTQNTITTISFPKNDDEQITIYFVKVGNEWEINKLELTQSSG